ncbi:MAG: hypothetical protein O2856_08840 [Planctomycetota bacterium]|nr:hypothetical protein [Planctomycetota bacterium]
MKHDEAFELAIQWRDDPALLVGDLRAAMNWLWQYSNEATDVVARATGARTIDASSKPEVLERLIPLHKALGKYTILLKGTNLTPDLLESVLESLTAVEQASESNSITLHGLNSVIDAIDLTQRWVDKQVRLRGEEGNRSEVLKTTIEFLDNELLVKTDQDGSLKLRGSTNIPMFLAFFRTAKHFLKTEAFLDIDRTVKPTNLDRHRVRLSSKLHDVLIEIVSEKDGYRMRNYRP